MRFVDASIFVAVQVREEGWERQFDSLLPERTVTSPVALFEAGLVVGSRRGISKQDGFADVRALADKMQVAIESFREEDAAAAAAAYDTYGKGSGSKAKLNMGDCFAYAMAKRLGATLLYKGDDFAHTDMA